jgi:succinate-acetate transporter protein
MIQIRQTPNQTYMEDAKSIIVFRQEADTVTILTTYGDFEELLAVVMAFPQRTITHGRLKCPDSVIKTFALAGFSVFTSKEEMMGTLIFLGLVAYFLEGVWSCLTSSK